MWLVFSLALAAPPELGLEPDRVMSLGLSLAPLVGVDGDAGGLGQATIMVHLPPFSIEIIGAEGAMTGATRVTGFIGIGLRKHIVLGTWMRLLFAHHHETLWGDFLDEPFGAVAGTHGNIAHRSGFDAGVGWSRPLGGPGLDERLVFDLGASVRVLPGAHEPPVYIGLQLGILGRVGPVWVRKRAAAEAAEPAPPSI